MRKHAQDVCMLEAEAQGLELIAVSPVSPHQEVDGLVTESSRIHDRRICDRML